MDSLDTQLQPQSLFSLDIFSNLTGQNPTESAPVAQGLGQLPTFLLDPIFGDNVSVNQPILIESKSTSNVIEDYLANSLKSQASVSSAVSSTSSNTLQIINQALTANITPNIGGIALPTGVSEAVTNRFQSFFSQDNYQAELQVAFGDNFDRTAAVQLPSLFNNRDLSQVPTIQVLTDRQLNGTLGAYDSTNNKIYLSQDLLATGDIEQIVPVLIEEIGHYIDTKINRQDAPGDEGEIFARLVDKDPISATQLVGLKAQDDTAVLTISGQKVTVEQADGDPGIYTVDKSGKVTIDFLADAGDYRNQMGIFSLTGMENLTPGSEAFIKEAARRALSGTDGYVSVSQTIETGKFQLEAGRDSGKYTGRNVYNFKVGDKVALIMVPNGTIQELFDQPTLDGSKRPLFSIAAANPGNYQQIGELDNSVFGWEDIRRDKNSDADFNDLLFQIRGVTGVTPKLSSLIAPQWKWQEAKVCKDLISYAGEQVLEEDTIAPMLSIALAKDTGISKTDNITNDPTIVGKATDNDGVVELTAQFKDGAVVSILDKLKFNGELQLDRATLETIYGKTLADGEYTLNLSAGDDSGNKTSTSLKFTLDTTKPIVPTLDLLPELVSTTVTSKLATDALSAGFTGKTEANVQVKIEKTVPGSIIPVTLAAVADAQGDYKLAGVDLAFGLNNFRVTATDIAGNSSVLDESIRCVAKDDVVITWNKIALDAVKVDKTAPPAAERVLTIVETSVYDAVNNIARVYKPYHVDKIAPLGASQEAAAAEAAYRALIELYPNQKATFDAALTKSLAAIADSQSKTDGIAFGKDVAEAMLAWRSTDGSKTKVNYTPDPNKAPGRWQPTPPANGAAVLPQWGNITPFVITDASSYLPPTPPALDSEKYATEYNQVKDLGSATSTTRTVDQTEIAKFWADGGGTYTPPGHWNQIAESAAVINGNSILENARLFGTLNVALADAAICCWNAKYTFDRWRPITAIRAGDQDGNDKTTVDANWTSLLTTPAFPEYTSGHSTFSGAADSVLTSFFGDNYAFSTYSVGLPGVTRNFTSFRQAADEAGISRIYGGIHFNAANVEGLNAGRKIGDFAIKNFGTKM